MSFLNFLFNLLNKFMISWGWGGGVIFQNSRVSEKNLISKTYAKVVIFYFFNVDLPYFFLQINNPSFCCSVNFYSIFRCFYPKQVILTHLGDWSEPELLLYIPLLYYTNLPVHVYICVWEVYKTLRCPYVSLFLQK